MAKARGIHVMTKRRQCGREARPAALATALADQTETLNIFQVRDHDLSSTTTNTRTVAFLGNQDFACFDSRMTIRDVMKDPFGPYPASLILSSAALPRALTLDSVAMLFASSERITGLEETDTKSYEDLAEDVHIYGELVVEKLDWFSEAGMEILGKDLRRRDKRLNPGSQGYLTLQRIIRDTNKDLTDERRLKVTIQCKKEKQAAFMTADKHPTSLILYCWISENRIGNLMELIVNSFEAQTYEKSHVYLERWRLLAFVKQTIKEQQDPPKEDRTIYWLIRAMRERYKRDSAYRRLIFDPEEATDIEDLVTGRTKRRRHPVHLSKAECADILATHAEWFLAQQLFTSRKEHHLVNLRNWYDFCTKSKNMWPDRYGREIDMTKFGHDRRWWRETIQRVIFNPQPQKPRIEQAIDIVISKDQDMEDDSQEFLANYDPDFAGDESSEYSDSSYGGSRSSSPNPSRLAEKVPWYCWKEPKFLDWTWECPDGNCRFCINLRDVRHPAADGRRMSLSLQGKKMKKVVFPIIAEHYSEHMHRNGVHLRTVSTRPLRTVLEEWPQPGVQPQPQAHIVKEEDND
ncbi:hypothetical protein E1B28_013581 [Marasmius oreades]|uniref:Uncharacterized protein n=1 Tax=Marasmius oreades TaxID=181124 RepID=A0A9P7UMY4_9AGAR|nr:uncharacterized protein E1B28_013581 [Marasmius oreades]KAG7087633.1 hypothetical protein E1B28_013581 [Marasmius oreades]